MEEEHGGTHTRTSWRPLLTPPSPRTHPSRAHTHPSMRVGYMDPKDVWLSYWRGEHKWRELWACAAGPRQTAHLPPTDPAMSPHTVHPLGPTP